MRHQGFTLIEMLVVMALIAILGTFFTMQLLGQVRNARVREAATSVSTELQALKSASVKQSRSMTFSWSPATPDRYTTDLSGTEVTRTLPNGMRLSCVAVAPVPCPTTNRVTFRAPAGEASTGLILRVEPAPGTGAADPIFVKVIGLLGKVVLSETSD